MRLFERSGLINKLNGEGDFRIDAVGESVGDGLCSLFVRIAVDIDIPLLYIGNVVLDYLFEFLIGTHANLP